MNKEKIILILIFIINCILVVSWFSNGAYLATGETSLIFDNPIMLLSKILHSWAPNFLGAYNSTGFSDIPFYLFLSILQFVRLPGYLIQMTLFLILLQCMFFSYYLLIKQFLKDKRICIFASLFYIYNTFAMVDVWARFQFTFMFYYAFAPLGLYLIIMGIRNRKYSYGLYFAIISVIFADFFASVPHFLLFWLIIGLYILFNALSKRKDILFVFKFTLLTVFLFLIFNAFWIVPFIQGLITTSYITKVAYSSSDSYQTFQILSESLGDLSYIFRLMHKGYFSGKTDTWGVIFSSPFYIAISYLIPLFTFMAILADKYRRKLKFFILLSVIGLFFIKGSNPPFGYVTDILFQRIKILEAFRNPFEKMGFLLPLAFSPLLAVGLFSVYDWVKNNKRTNTILFKAGLISIGIVIIFILPFPIWNGWIFSQPIYYKISSISKQVKLPDYYNLADKWLQNNSGDNRIIALPLGGEGMTYNWGNYGYSGIELSNTIFHSPFISIKTSIPFSENIVPNIEGYLIHNPDNFSDYLKFMGANTVMVRKDIDYDIERLRNPDVFIDLFKKGIYNIKQVNKFGPLYFYSIGNQKADDNNRIYAANSVIAINSNSIFDYNNLPEIDQNAVFLNEINPDSNKLIRQVLLKGQAVNRLYSDMDSSTAISNLNTTSILPDSDLFFIKTIKNYLEDSLFTGFPKEQLDVKESAQEIYSLYSLVEKRKYDLLDVSLLRYDSKLEYFRHNLNIFGTDNKRKQLIAQKMVMAKILFNIPEQYRYKIKLRYDKLIQLLRDLKLEPVYYKGKDYYQFTVRQSGFYNVLIPQNLFYNPASAAGKQVIFINGKTVEVTPKQAGKYFSFGRYYFNEGNYELGFQFKEDVNIIYYYNSEKVIKVTDKDKIVDYPISTINPAASYQISFDYLLEKGYPAILQFNQNNDPITLNRERLPDNYTIGPVNYNYTWNHYVESFKSNQRADTAYFRIIVSPFHICTKSAVIAVECEKTKIPAILHLRNFVIKQIPTYDVYLDKSNQFNNKPVPNISYQRINPSKYLIKITDATSPYILVFSDIYHNLWNAYIIDNNNQISTIPDSDHLFTNGFSNGWYLDKSGNYKIVLEFKAQNTHIQTMLVSGIAIFLGICFIFFRRKRKIK